MPLCPQITNTPIVLPREVAITAVSFTPTTATYTASGHSFVAGNVVVITGLLPNGYNGTFTISSVSGSTTFTVPNSTNTSVTDQSGLATPGGDFVNSSVVPVLAANTEQLAATDAAVALAVADANAAAAAAAAAQASAATANANAIAANTAAGVAQATANGKNKVTYSTSTPGSTANAIGDIWYQYGTASPNVGRIIAQYMGAGGTSWTQTTVSGLVIANIDAGNITTGTLTAAVGISNPSGNFSVNGATGALIASSATITGTVNAISGYFGTLTDGFSISSTGLVGVGTGIIVGGTIATAASGQRITLNSSSDNAIKIYPDSSLQPGFISASTASGVGSLKINGPFTSGWNNSNIQLYSLASTTSYIQLTGDVVQVAGGFSVSQGSIFSGSAQFSSSITYPGVATGAGTAMVVVTTGSRVAIVTSSERFKEEIKYINTTGWLDKVMQMKPITYKTSEDFTTEGEPNETQIGFLAEDIYDIGGDLEKAVVLDPLGDPFSLSYDRLTVFLMLAIKELKAEIDTLKGE
jgi:hypothetical protein